MTPNNEGFAFLNGNNTVEVQDPSELMLLLAKWTNCQTYLELGVWYGGTFSKMARAVPCAIGVDIKDQRDDKSVGIFFEESTDDFFSAYKGQADLILIDADHNVESVVKDLKNALEHLSAYGIIVLHDTDPATYYFTQPSLCHNVFLIHQVLDADPSLCYVTLPSSNAGITIVRKRNERRVNQYIK